MSHINLLLFFFFFISFSYRLGEQGNPTYIYRLLQRFSENITDDFHSNGSKLFSVSKSLMPDKTYVIKGHLSDIRNCKGDEDKKEMKCK
jgi:hypothetical protein